MAEYSRPLLGGYVVSPGGFDEDEDQHQAPQMDRSKLSDSSIESEFSLGSSIDQSYTESPLSSLYSPWQEGDFMHQTSFIEPPQNSFSSPETPTSYREPSTGSTWDRNIELPLFNIEKDGDPNIHWIMYYSFFVTKTEAYYQLQPGYLPTDKYPPRVDSVKITT